MAVRVGLTVQRLTEGAAAALLPATESAAMAGAVSATPSNSAAVRVRVGMDGFLC